MRDRDWMLRPHPVCFVNRPARLHFTLTPLFPPPILRRSIFEARSPIIRFGDALVSRAFVQRSHGMGRHSGSARQHRGRPRFSSRGSFILLILCVISFCFVARLLDGLLPASAKDPTRTRPVAGPPQPKSGQSAPKNVVAVVNRTSRQSKMK